MVTKTRKPKDPSRPNDSDSDSDVSIITSATPSIALAPNSSTSEDAARNATPPAIDTDEFEIMTSASESAFTDAEATDTDMKSETSAGSDDTLGPRGVLQARIRPDGPIWNRSIFGDDATVNQGGSSANRGETPLSHAAVTQLNQQGTEQSAPEMVVRMYSEITSAVPMVSDASSLLAAAPAASEDAPIIKPEIISDLLSENKLPTLSLSQTVPAPPSIRTYSQVASKALAVPDTTTYPSNRHMSQDAYEEAVKAHHPMISGTSVTNSMSIEDGRDALLAVQESSHLTPSRPIKTAKSSLEAKRALAQTYHSWADEFRAPVSASKMDSTVKLSGKDEIKPTAVDSTVAGVPKESTEAVPAPGDAVIDGNSTLSISSAPTPSVSNKIPSSTGTSLPQTAAIEVGTPAVPIASNVDLLSEMKMTYRLLELYQEQGSGGLVEKVLIDQASVIRLANAVTPASAGPEISQVNFALLDNKQLRIVGVYGTAERLVHLLQRRGVIDSQTAARLLTSDEGDIRKPYLRPGLYFAACGETEGFGNGALVFFWPEKTTWDDNAMTNAARNRITFMRYLSQLTDQIYCVTTRDQVDLMQWGQRDEYFGSEDEDDDRCLNLKVERTNEQEEGISLQTLVRKLSFMADQQDKDSVTTECLEKLKPRLVTGHRNAGLLTAKYYSAEATTRLHQNVKMYPAKVKDLFKGGRSVIQFDVEGIHDVETILKEQLVPEGSHAHAEWKKIQEASKKARDEAHQKGLNALQQDVDSRKSTYVQSAVYVVSRDMKERFPLFAEEIDSECAKLQGGPAVSHNPECVRECLEILHRSDKYNDKLVESINTIAYKECKREFLVAVYALRQHPKATDGQKGEIYDELMKIFAAPSRQEAKDKQDGASRNKKRSEKGMFSSLVSTMVGLFSKSDPKDFVQTYDDDIKFLEDLSYLAETDMILAEAAAQLRSMMVDWGRKMINEFVDLAHKQIHKKTMDSAKASNKDKSSKQEAADRVTDRRAFIMWLNTEFEKRSPSAAGGRRISVRSLENPPAANYGFYSTRTEPLMTYEEDATSPPRIVYTITPIGFNESDKQHIMEDSAHIPSPILRAQNRLTFPLTPQQILRSIYYLDEAQTKVLAFVDNHAGGHLEIYLTHFNEPAKRLPYASIGEGYVTAVDLAKRKIAIVSAKQAQIHFYQLEENLLSLAMSGSVDLSKWYPDGVQYTGASFITATDDLVIIDGTRARIYSLLAQQCRPASLQIPGDAPSSVISTPDGSCMLVQQKLDGIEDDERVSGVRGYQRKSFGARVDGHILDVTLSPDDYLATFTLQSFEHVFLVILRAKREIIEIRRLDIRKETSELQLRSTMSAQRSQDTVEVKKNDCLLKSFEVMWTRFPVATPIKRDNLADNIRQPRKIALITDIDISDRTEAFGQYWRGLINSFSSTSKKPTDGVLENTSAELNTTENVRFFAESSQFRFGQWLVELFCLIPLHLAVAKDNRFTPYNNGRDDSEWERSMLGADVHSLADSISLGWYEAILGTYFGDRPVRVISSLGNQSVGKSYSLNHIASSSFAGAAGRTTEGVWLAVAPTKDCIYVMLDFEGVNSPERSAQEDLLLVLFNTALSNMILFRNHLNLSRDFRKMFTSFQSSANILSPEDNPQLFNGLMVLIIKDVVDSDRKEAKREFESKFRDIVNEEGEDNFVTRLHRGQLQIVTWPVIENEKFYTQFTQLKKTLLQQKITYSSTADFARTLKLLEAKLKASDWTSMDSSIVTQRAKRLRAILPVAIALGKSDAIDREPLKNLDTLEICVHNLPVWSDEMTLSAVVKGGSDSSYSDIKRQYLLANPRNVSDPHWRDRFAAEIGGIIERRSQLVRDWLESNVSRFPTGSSDVLQLRTEMEHTFLDLQAKYRLCSAGCDRCGHQCLKLHDHDRSHDCDTSHRCDGVCEYQEEHDGVQRRSNCGLSALHDGHHVCDPKAHLCGEMCDLEQSCKARCTKSRGHSDDAHMCSARTHQCAETCSLNIDGKYDCHARCVIPVGDDHERHSCRDSSSCLMKCMLCPRLCATPDHFHGLEDQAVHLCGQTHACSKMCEQDGICSVASQPHSIETSFRGAHSSFQYTKYTQEAKRLPCAVIIPSGQIIHTGPHVHSETNDFHSCKTQCAACQYYCTLPLGHNQAEHDTVHGNMTQTKWSIDDGEEMEVGGHKFAAGDEGAPMLCNMFCSGRSRHVHMDYCRQSNGPCAGGEEFDHVHKKMNPNPLKPKDNITHNLYWGRAGFKDPYSQAEQKEFMLCDHECAGEEHKATDTSPSAPSHCVLPLFHPPAYPGTSAGGNGYISSDGHSYTCKNPALLQQAFHIIFVLDRSGSMSSNDRRPATDTPVSSKIQRRADNRYGAVLSACYSFWSARDAVIQSAGAAASRRDAYSLILFNESPAVIAQNDYSSSPEALLNMGLRVGAGGGTNFASALLTAQTVMDTNWSSERTPVLIFLSDGECSISDYQIYPICQRAVALGKALNVHAVSFGPDGSSVSLRRMADIGKEVYASAPRDPLAPSGTNACSFSTALDTVSLASTFLGIAESLRKPRGSLMTA